jgi:hypothetical protein
MNEGVAALQVFAGRNEGVSESQVFGGSPLLQHGEPDFSPAKKRVWQTGL